MFLADASDGATSDADSFRLAWHNLWTTSVALLALPAVCFCTFGAMTCARMQALSRNAASRTLQVRVKILLRYVCLPSGSAARWLDCRCHRDVHLVMHRLSRRYAAPAADATRQGGRLAFHLLARKDSELKPSAGTQRSATRDTIRVVHMLYAAPRFTGKRVDHRSDSQQATFSDVGCVYEFLLFCAQRRKLCC